MAAPPNDGEAPRRPRKGTAKKRAPSPPKRAASKEASAKKQGAKKQGAKKETARKPAAERPTPDVTSPAGPPPPYLEFVPRADVPPANTLIVSFEGRARQRRLTIAFRVFLALPHLVYLSVLGVVGILAAIVGWFCALVLGRLPSGIAALLGGIVQYSARVSAYAGFLLTDRYPPFSLRAPDYPVSVEVVHRRLNRAAVFFRFTLAIPAAFLVNIVLIGFQIAAPFIWLIALVAGRLPRALFEGEAAVLRFVTRYYAYAWLLTGEYPSGLFGDPG